MNIIQDKIEILSVKLLDQYRNQVREFRRLSRQLHIPIGWHYLLDLIWIVGNVGNVYGQHLLDAGGGVGLLQAYLMEHGALKVISVDRMDRSDLALDFQARYSVSGIHHTDLKPASAGFRKAIQSANGAKKILAAGRGLFSLFRTILPKAYPGELVFYNQDLAAMTDVADNSLDVVVAVSALEHNPPEALPAVVTGIMRKIKPGGRLLATLGAAREKDWYHDPSLGWNYSEATLRRLFALTPEAPSNYVHHDELLAALRDCAELRDDLAAFYSKSGENGMPWGKWDPVYQPVGVCKVKTS